MPLRQLHRVRWGVRACLALGVAASVAANVLHAMPNPIAKAIAAWPPLALLLTVELISRVPVHRRSLAAVRLAATAAIAGIAAWVSYWHMAGVAARYGEAGAAPYLLPMSVDGLVVVASVSLVELAGRIRAAHQDQKDTGRRAPAPEAAGPTRTDPVRVGAAPAAPEPTPVPVGAAAAAPSSAPPVPVGAAAAAPEPDLAPAAPRVGLVEAKPLGALLNERLSAGRSRPRTAAANATSRSASTARVPAARRPTNAPPKRGRPRAETRRLAAELAAELPEATPDDIARTLGITTNHLKRVLAAA